MAVSYAKLWKLLVDKRMSKCSLRKAARISPNTMTKMRRDEPVMFSVLDKICETLNCDYGDIIGFVPDVRNETGSNKNDCLKVKETIDATLQ